MSETILNIYLVIEKGLVILFKAKAYEKEGSDVNKISFLKERVVTDYESSYKFEAPRNKKGDFMPYKKFSKLESQGMQYRLFEEIFQKFNVPQNPLICVTPVVDGKIMTS